MITYLERLGDRLGGAPTTIPEGDGRPPVAVVARGLVRRVVLVLLLCVGMLVGQTSVATAATPIRFPLNTTTSVIKSNSPTWCYTRLTNCHHNYNAADIFAPTGTPVVSPVAGVVRSATNASSGVGSRVQIRADDGRLWYLAHMHHSPGLRVSVGQRVQPGTQLGNVGTSAHAVGTPPHLHIDMLPPPYTSRPSCSGAACKQYPFQNVQGMLVEAFHNLDSKYTGPDFILKNTLASGNANITFDAFTKGLEPGDIPVVGDWNGDGKFGYGVVRGDRFILRNSLSSGAASYNFQAFTQGLQSGDIPIVGDWDGDGKFGYGVVRGNNFILRNSLSSGTANYNFQAFTQGLQSGDIPVVGDWNGDGKFGYGVVRGNNFILRNSLSSGAASYNFSAFNNGIRPKDTPLVGDWNGNGSYGYGVMRVG